MRFRTLREVFSQVVPHVDEGTTVPMTAVSKYLNYSLPSIYNALENDKLSYNLAQDVVRAAEGRVTLEDIAPWTTPHKHSHGNFPKLYALLQRTGVTPAHCKEAKSHAQLAKTLDWAQPTLRLVLARGYLNPEQYCDVLAMGHGGITAKEIRPWLFTNTRYKHSPLYKLLAKNTPKPATGQASFTSICRALTISPHSLWNILITEHIPEKIAKKICEAKHVSLTHKDLRPWTPMTNSFLVSRLQNHTHRKLWDIVREGDAADGEPLSYPTMRYLAARLGISRFRLMKLIHSGTMSFDTYEHICNHALCNLSKDAKAELRAMANYTHKKAPNYTS